MINSNFLQNTRTYASVSNLEKALDKYNLTQFAPIIVGIPETDRVTAVFQYFKVEHAVIAVCNKGFAVI